MTWKEKNIVIIKKEELEYPIQLKKIHNKPDKLYTLGNIENLRKKCVAIVGSRKCTKYGYYTAKKIAYILAQRGYCIVSGLAKGIDSAAHIGALEAKGRTIVVLGNGLNRIYPKDNTCLAKEILKKNGTIITEYSINEIINRYSFVKRNRIISGISKSIIVVEAELKSGALITANFGIEQGRDVYCVPGKLINSTSRGTNELIKNGAQILYSFTNCNII